MQIRNLVRAVVLVLLTAGTTSTWAVAVGTQFPKHLATLRYENSSGERGVSFFETNESGFPTHAIWMMEDGSRSSINRYVVEGGFVIDAQRSFSDGIRVTESAEIEDRRLAKEYFERSDGVKGFARYEYDEGGRVVRIVCERAKGWFTGEIVPVYAEDGLLREAGILQKGERTGTIVYTRADGKLVKEHWDFNGKWTQTFSYEYDHCDPAGSGRVAVLNAFANPGSSHRVSKETYDFSGETGGPSTFVYDRNGKLVAKQFVRSDGLTTDTDYLYDCRGHVKKSWRRYSGGGAAVFSYEFDDRGLLVSRDFVTTDGKTGRESYVRNASGALQRARYDNMDSWLTGTIEFETDGEGRLRSGTFQGDDGSTASITFRHDDEGNPTRIEWRFSFGKTQVYTFEYE